MLSRTEIQEVEKNNVEWLSKIGGVLFCTREGRIVTNSKDSLRLAILYAARDGVSLCGTVVYMEDSPTQNELDDLNVLGVTKLFCSNFEEGLNTYGISLQRRRNKRDEHRKKGECNQ